MELPDYQLADPRYYTLPRAELRALADERLRTQLRYVYATTPFWRRKLDAAGVEPAHFRGLDDLDRLPFCTKQELQEDQAAHSPFGSYVASPRTRWSPWRPAARPAGRCAASSRRATGAASSTASCASRVVWRRAT
jgi:phenylacetate-CoA ligase